LVCAVLRLARFNVELTPDTGSKKFRGLPSPAAAGCIASLAVLLAEFRNRFPGVDEELVRGVVQVWATLGALVVALLMVSRVPYPHMTKYLLRGRRHFDHLVLIVLAAFVIAIVQELALALIFWGYTAFVLARFAVTRALEPAPVPAPVPAGPVDEAAPN
jgi:CDP-diacylglycerol--serine O-phosphatidyltransferase